MVLESLVNPMSARKKPWEMFFIGIFYATIAMFLSMWIFHEQASLIMVFLTVLACVPLIYTTIKQEEAAEDSKKEIILLKEHSRILYFLICLFFGFIVAFSAWYVFLPSDMTQTLFSTQIQTINAINARISGTGSFIGVGSISVSGSLTSTELFSKILANNVKVLMFCLFFSFFYGAGAIFILTWNSTVISAAIGNFVRNNLGNLTGISYFSIFSIGVFRYMTHGIFEILAYFMGGLAGGIVSIAVIKHEIGTKRFIHVLVDSIDLVLLAIGVLILAAFVEVYITPALF